jgi:hypothetical protein
MAVMQTLFASRFGPDPFASLLCEMRHLTHANLELIYLGACASRPQKSTPPSFSAFEDKKRYAGTHPSTTYCKAVFVDYSSAHRVYLDRVMASLPGEVLKGDHTFKVRAGRSILMALLTIRPGGQELGSDGGRANTHCIILGCE